MRSNNFYRRNNNDLDDIKLNIKVALIVIVFFIIALGLAALIQRGIDFNKWNDGYCSCGGNWVYDQAVGHEYTTSYIYECDKCGKHIEISEQRWK